MTHTTAQVLVAMLNVEVDIVRDLRATLRLDGLRAEERGKGEDEERERYLAEHGGGRRERGGRELQTWSFPLATRHHLPRVPSPSGRSRLDLSTSISKGFKTDDDGRRYHPQLCGRRQCTPSQGEEQGDAR